MATAAFGSTSPSNGQPHTVDTYPRTRMPSARAMPATSSHTASVAATVLFTFFLLCVSLTEAKTATSRNPTARARPKPMAFGQSALNVTPGGATA